MEELHSTPHPVTRSFFHSHRMLQVALLHRRITASRQAWLMRRCSTRESTPRSGFAGFRFPPEVIILAVRWCLRSGLMPLWMSSG